MKLELNRDDFTTNNLHEEAEKLLYRQVIQFARYNKVRAAKILGVSRGSLTMKLSAWFGTEFNTRGEK